MNAKVVIDVVALRGSPDLQRVGVVLVDGHEYTIYAPGSAKGMVRKFKDHLSVRQSSLDTPGAEVAVTATAAKAVLELLDRQLEVEEQIWNWGNDSASYHSACICLNGHVLSADGSIELRYPEGRKSDEWCPTCGKRCITRCKHCNAPIRGKQTMRMEDYVTPLFCYNCSQPYPWMENTLETARALLDNDDKLTADDRTQLFDLLQYVMSDPMSPLTPAKRKLIDVKLTKSAAAATREFVIEFLAKYSAEMSKP